MCSGYVNWKVYFCYSVPWKIRHCFVPKSFQRPMAGFQTLFDPSQENLEQRLAEADAYQKILEQQIKVYTSDNEFISFTLYKYTSSHL